MMGKLRRESGAMTKLRCLFGAGAAIIAVTVGGCASSGQYSSSVIENLPANQSADGPQPGDSVVGSYLAARSARANRDFGAAADYFAYALGADPTNQSLVRRTFLVMLADGRMKSAVQLAAKAQEDRNSDAMANLVLAMDAFRTANYGKAREHLELADRSGFMRLMVTLLTAWTHAGDGNIDQAVETLDQLVETDAFTPFRIFHQALILDLGNRQETADLAYRETLESSARTSIRPTIAYGSFLRRDGNGEMARSVYGNYLDQAAASTIIRRELAETGSVVPPQMIQKAEYGAAEALFGAASILAQDRARDTATIYLRLALLARPDFPVAQATLADIAERDGDWQKAIATYRTITPGSEYSWNGRIRTAWALNQLERTDEAIGLLADMANERPHDTEPLVTLADILRSKERYGEAADNYAQAIARIDEPQERHWSLYYARGIAHERAKQWDLAEVDFLKALELRPDQPLVLNYLGYSWADQGVNLDRAVKMIERAVSLRPNDGYIVDSLGWVNYRLGQYSKAVENLERAVELRPDDPVINDHLGDAYWRVGRRKEARFQWRRALSLDPEIAQVPLIEAKLETGLGASLPGKNQIGQGG